MHTTHVRAQNARMPTKRIAEGSMKAVPSTHCRGIDYRFIFGPINHQKSSHLFVPQRIHSLMRAKKFVATETENMPQS